MVKVKLDRVIHFFIGTGAAFGVYSFINPNVNQIRKDVNTEEEVQRVLTGMRNTVVINGVLAMIGVLAKKPYIGVGLGVSTTGILILAGQALSEKEFDIDWLRFSIKNISSMGFSKVERMDVE